MARWSDNPQAWNELLIALGRDDTKTAQKIAITYGFWKNQQPERYNYYCKTPDGKVNTFGTMKKLAEFLGIAPRSVGSRFNIGNLTWEIGRLKGHEIWRNLK